MFLDPSRKPAGRKRTVLCFLVVSLVLHVALLVFLVGSERVRERPSRVEVGLVTLPPRAAGERSAPEADPSAVASPAPQLQTVSSRAAAPRVVKKEVRDAAADSAEVKLKTDPPRLETAPQRARKPPVSDKKEVVADRVPVEFSSPEENGLASPSNLTDAEPGPERQASVPEKGTESSTVPLVEARPRYDRNAPPPYPRLARERGWEGEVLLRVFVSETGDVRNVSIERSSTHAILDAAALRAVRRWRFHPSRIGATAVAGEVLVPLRFELRDY